MYEFLQEKGKFSPILYVEDNDGLREKALRFFKKFFNTVYLGRDGEEGLALYKKHQPKIIVTDIKMPKLNGLDMVKKIKLLNPNVKVIVTTAFDDKEFLLNAIKIGIFRYVNKPFNIKEITEILTECLELIDREEQQATFNQNIQDIFEYQDNLLLLVENDKPIVENCNFLNFLKLDSLNEFVEKYKYFSTIFMEEDNFLYGNNSLEVIMQDSTSLFNVKMQKDGEDYHFVLKVKKVPNDDNQYIFSFSDITELGLLKGSSVDHTSEENIVQLMKTIKNNSGTLKVHNYYKGLSITNEAEIVEVEKNSLRIKVNYLQAKALNREKLFILSSPFLPKNILCKDISEINYSTQTVVSKNYSFIDSSPTKRKDIRVYPESYHKAIAFYNSTKFIGEVQDVSVRSVRVKLNTLPDGIKVGDKIKIDIILGKGEKEFLIQNTSEIFRIYSYDNTNSIVVFLEIDDSTKKSLIEYISKRQLALIREFKGLEKEHF